MGTTSNYSLSIVFPTPVRSLSGRIFSKLRFTCFYECIIRNSVKPGTVMGDISCFSPVHKTCYPVVKINQLILTQYAFDKTSLGAIHLLVVFE